MMRGIEQYLQVDAATLGALKYQGVWNASTNTPTLTSGVGVQGQYYVVSVAGTTNLDGETNWGVGDWAVFNGTVWQKVDGGSTGNLTTLTVTGNTNLATTSGSVGIGTASPNRRLEVLGTGGIPARVASPDSNMVIEYYSNLGTRFNWIAGPQYNVSGAFEITPSTVAGGTTYSTPAITVLNTGNVGIGTTSPGFKLDVQGTTAADARIIATDNATGKAKLYIRGGTANFSYESDVSNSSNYLFDNTNGHLAKRYIAGASGYWQFFTANTERIRIDSAGNVGIGVTNPAVPLEVIGQTTVDGAATGAATGTFLIKGAKSDSQGFKFTFNNSTNLADITNFFSGAMTFGTNNLERMRIDSTGNVGVGVTPSAWGTIKAIEIGGNGGTYFASAGSVLYAGANNYYNGTNYIYKTTGATSQYQQISGQHQWFTAPSGTVGTAVSFTTAMTLDVSGNLGVGVTPTTRMQVSGGLAVQSGTGTFPSSGLGLELYNNDASTNYIQSYNRTGSSYMNTVYNALSHAFRISGTERFSIDSNSNVSVGTAALATTATNGFLYIPTCAGIPTGVPTAKTGLVPMVYDSTNNKFYIYNGAWKSVALL